MIIKRFEDGSIYKKNKKGTIKTKNLVLISSKQKRKRSTETKIKTKRFHHLVFVSAYKCL